MFVVAFPIELWFVTKKKEMQLPLQKGMCHRSSPCVNRTLFPTRGDVVITNTHLPEQKKEDKRQLSFCKQHFFSLRRTRTMEQSVHYAYIDEGSISKRLKCPVCGSPFLDPVSIRCRHTFCRECIQDRLGVDPSCPECKQNSSVDHLVEPPLLLIDMLNDLLVKCVECQEEGIRRSEFQCHIDEVCPETAVCCPAAAVQCPWKGRTKELPLHVESCHYEQLRPILTKLIAENVRLQRQIVKQGIRIDSPDGRRGATLGEAATIAALREEVQFLKSKWILDDSEYQHCFLRSL